MRNTNKKGFTIIELVIVIAVIAILAAVLIPTFAGIIAKANQSSDIQATRQMNTALAVAGDLDDIDDVIDALAEAGFNSKDALIPVSTGYTFYWYANAKQIVLENENGEVVFPEGVEKETGVSLENSVEYIDVSAGTAGDLASAVNNGSKDITLTESISGIDAITVPAGQELVLDLGGKSLSSGTRNPYDHQYALNVFGTVTITNGTIDARGVEVRNGGKLIIGEGVTINAVDDNGGAAVYLYAGAEVEINGGTFKSLAAKDSLNGGSVILNNGGKVTINGGTFISEVDGPYVINHWGGETIINGGTFEGARGVVGAHVSGTVTINGGTFTKTNADYPGYEMYCQTGATLIINGGTFTEDPHNNGGTITDNR